MLLFHKITTSDRPGYGINYRPEDDGTEIFIKIPFWVFWREKYLDFDTKIFKSGKAVRAFIIYIRRRSDSVMPDGYIPYYRWIFYCMFGVVPYGEQECVATRWHEDYKRLKESWDATNACS